MALLKFKRSAVSGKAPALADLELGELAINTFDGKVYMRKDNGTASIIEVGGGSGVLSFNSRTGAVTLSSGDVTTALGFTPASTSGPTFSNGVTVNNGSNQVQIAYDGNLEIVRAAGGAYIDFKNSTGEDFDSRIQESGGLLNISNGVRSPIFYDSQDTAFYTDPNSISVISRLTAGGREMVGSAQISMSGLDANTWYPVTIALPAFRRTTLRIENALNSNVPSWSTHPGGFSCFIEWVSNGSGWGTIDVSRYINNWRESFTSVTIVGGLSQMGFSSQEVIWLRGGANYFFSADANVTPVVRTTSYTEYGQTVEPRSTVFNSPYDAATGRIAFGSVTATSSVNASVDVRAPIFYDSNNTAFYFDGASTTNINQLNGNGKTIFETGDGYLRINQSASFASGVWFGGSNVGMANATLHIGSNGDPGLSRIRLIGGSYNGQTVLTLDGTSGIGTAIDSWRAPVFYDSNDTNYYVNPNGFTRVETLGVVNERQYPGSMNSDWEGGYYHFGPGNDTPTGSYGHAHIIRLSSVWNVQMFFPTSNTNEPFWLRRLQNGTYSAWRRLLQEDEWIGSKYLASDGRIYGTILYDSNNTAYYVDPNANSVLYSFDNINQRCSYSRQWDNYPGISVYNTTDQGPQGDFRIFGSAGANGGDFSVRLLVDGNIQTLADLVGNAVYGTIFYDNNNTSCYVDPSGTSWFKGNIYSWRPGPSNDCFGGIEIREADGVANANTSASYAPGINFHWSMIAAARIYMASNGAFVLGGQSDITNNRRSLFCSEIYATGNVTAYYSDERLKTRIGNIDNALGIISSLSGFRYVNNDLAKSFGYDGDEVQLGISAQEVQAVLPEVVRQAAFDIDLDSPEQASKSGEDYLTVDYSRLVPLLIEAIKELNNKVETLEASIRSK